MPLQIPDPTRQTPASIDRASDLCRKWSLWGRGDHLDSIICCKMFPSRHMLNDSDIAKALAKTHKECANMTGQDVAELYCFLQRNPDLHTNGIRLWEGMKDKDGKGRHKDDDVKIALAIGRFTNHVYTGKF